MNNYHRARVFLACALAVGTSVTALGCAERDAINRVQPGALRKSVLDGEWYLQQTVVDAPYASFTFPGEQGELERIRWDIQEEYIYARRSYQFIANSESPGIAGEANEENAAVAAYKVEHFDIRREYNPVTGEELNIVSENTTDRPWYQRDYIRVDWSKNLVEDPNFMMAARAFDGVEAEPTQFYVEDPNDPFAPHFETRDESGNWIPVATHDGTQVSGDVQYFDIVNKMIVKPQSIDFEDWGVSIPVCWLFDRQHLDCAPEQVAVRSSFLRIGETIRGGEGEEDRRIEGFDHDYQPMVYTGDRMQRFGYFITERSGFDDHYGTVESAKFRFANRHNVWMESHRKDASGRPIACTAQNAAEVCGDPAHGSVCDLDLARALRTTQNGALVGACTIPYRERQVRKIAYHLSNNFEQQSADLVPDAQDLVDQWNSTFVDLVGSLRTIECEEAGGTDCASERLRADAQSIFVLCHGPVRETDDPACGAPGTEARAGDLRYSLIGLVSEPALTGPLGYGPSSADPITGEIVMANAFVYGAGLEMQASFGRDVVQLLNGELTEENIIEADNVRAWVEEHRTVRSGAVTGREADNHAIPTDGHDAEMYNAAMDFSWAHRHGVPEISSARSPRDLLAQLSAREDALFDASAYGTGSRPGLEALRDTSIERQMITPDMLLLAGIDPALYPDPARIPDDVLEAVSPLRKNSMAFHAALNRARQRMNADNCILDAEFADDGILGLAQQIKAIADDETSDGMIEWYGVRYPLRGEDGKLDYTLVRTMLRHPIFNAVTAHEVGHTVGLRHNFSGSFDALNYQPRYWELRSESGETFAPRAWDPETEAEVTGRIREYQYSTVMDYGVNFVVTDSHGVGHYDRAAIKMGYGDLIEVFNEVPRQKVIDVAWWNLLQGYGYPAVPNPYTNREPKAYQYTDWPSLVGGIAGIQARSDVRYNTLAPHEDIGGNQASEDVTHYASPDSALVQRDTNRPVVPYMFCSDEQADLGPDCQRYDAGADVYESVHSVIDSYWDYYIFTNFRRQRLGYAPWNVASRVHDRYFEKLQRANQIYVLNRAIFEGQYPANDPFWTDQHGMGAWTLAVGAGFDLLRHVISAPEPGLYQPSDRPEGGTAYLRLGDVGEPDDNDQVAVYPGAGRFLETRYDFDAGYYWFDQLKQVGYFYDKVIALEVLVDPTTYFIGRDTDADIRRYQISFASTFDQPTAQFMRGVMSQDWRAFAPRRGAGGGMVYPAPTQMGGSPMAGTPFDPNVSFSIELYAATLGMAYIPQTYNQDFLNMSRLFVRGGAEEIDLGAQPTVSFTDSDSGLTYIAPSYQENGYESGLSASMLRRALALQSPAPGNPIQQSAREQALRAYVDNLDIVRRLTWWLGFGAQP